LAKIAMGELRATVHSEKQARRQRILTAAEDLLQGWSFTDITMDRIAAKAGVAKGTLYLYFRTKEAIFLNLYEDRLVAWYEELESLAGLGSHTVESADAARVISSTLSAHPVLVLLHGLVNSTLAINIDADNFVAFRRRQRHCISSLASALAERIGGLSEARALRFLVQLEPLVGGLFWAAVRPPAVDRALEEPELVLFRVDFEEELREIITALLK
jgi:AcrR family transcriptional regulator